MEKKLRIALITMLIFAMTFCYAFAYEPGVYVKVGEGAYSPLVQGNTYGVGTTIWNNTPVKVPIFFDTYDYAASYGYVFPTPSDLEFDSSLVYYATVYLESGKEYSIKGLYSLSTITSNSDYEEHMDTDEPSDEVYGGKGWICGDNDPFDNKYEGIEFYGTVSSNKTIRENNETPTYNLINPIKYVYADDGTFISEMDVYKYNAELHQKEVATIQEAAKDWTTQCRTKVAKKGIRTYCYLDGLATEELYSYIDKGYTVTYDWYRADGKGKKFKYVDSTDKYSYLDNSVKKGKYYEYKVKVNLWDEDGNIYKSTLADCTKGYRTFK